MASDRYVINSVVRAMEILECFSPENPAYTNSELAKRLQLNKSTVTRLLHSLEKAGFLKRNPKTLEYQLTYRIHRLAAAYLQQVTLHSVAMPQLRQLVASCQETCHLALLDGFEVFFIDQVESPRSITLRSHAGVKLPAYCTGAGKMLLAHVDERELNFFLGAVKLKAFTENTITDRGHLKKHLEQIREQGFSLDNMEYQHEVRSVAAPVKDNTGQVIAAISIVGPGFRIKNPKTLEKHIAAARKTAAKISRQLGFLEG